MPTKRNINIEQTMVKKKSSIGKQTTTKNYYSIKQGKTGRQEAEKWVCCLELITQTSSLALKGDGVAALKKILEQYRF